MNTRRIAALSLVLLASVPLLLLAAAPQTAGSASALGFGSWSFTGKDKAGVVWKGPLVVEPVDPGMFDPKKYAAQGRLDIQGDDGSGKGFLTPIRFDPATRVFILGADSEYGSQVFTAVLSPDGKQLTKGTWRETEATSDGTSTKVIGEGVWSAARTDK